MRCALFQTGDHHCQKEIRRQEEEKGNSGFPQTWTHGITWSDCTLHISPL